MASDDQHERLANAYRRFADEEARGRSPLYEALARCVAEDTHAIQFLLTLPPPKRQPNLLLAAVRLLCGTAREYAEFRHSLLDHAEAVRALMLARSTQTNEPGRCATLLPVLAMLPQPLALIEVGASAGLCLLPDLYGYDYGPRRLRPADASPQPPIFPCAADAATPLPTALPRVVWRAGLDLSPIDLADAEQAAWLETLVWPEETDRLARLRAAMRVAAADPPRLVPGDLRRDVAALAAEAPKTATRVIFHTAVLAYVGEREERAAFAREVRSLCDVWISNEAPRVFAEIAERAGAIPTADAGYAAAGAGRFLLAVNGSPVAWTHSHGASMQWIAEPKEFRLHN